MLDTALQRLHTMKHLGILILDVDIGPASRKYILKILVMDAHAHFGIGSGPNLTLTIALLPTGPITTSIQHPVHLTGLSG